jgi:cytochrome o ubiquinol oxidase subunit 2
MSPFKTLCRLLPIVVIALLSGCSAVLLNPSGDIAVQQRNLIYYSTGLMMLIVLPVLVLIVLFAWRYRKSNAKAEYTPEWHHSTQLELVIWIAPLLIIIVLGTMTWISTHALDPYRPLSRLDAERSIPADVKPLVVEVVALDWKWLFIYPEQGIALVNEMAAPVDRPVTFHITSSSIMNSLFIPALAGQIYAMPGMQTKLHVVANKPGVFDGFSANYSGAGFSSMRFKFHALNNENFDQWVEKTKASGNALTRADYLNLEKPTQREPVKLYGTVDSSLYQAILNRCVESNKMCMNDIMAMDAMGGMGKAGTYNLASSTSNFASISDLGPKYVAAVCSVSNLATDFPVVN